MSLASAVCAIVQEGSPGRQGMAGGCELGPRVPGMPLRLLDRTADGMRGVRILEGIYRSPPPDRMQTPKTRIQHNTPEACATGSAQLSSTSIHGFGQLRSTSLRVRAVGAAEKA